MPARPDPSLLRGTTVRIIREYLGLTRGELAALLPVEADLHGAPHTPVAQHRLGLVECEHHRPLAGLRHVLEEMVEVLVFLHDLVRLPPIGQRRRRGRVSRIQRSEPLRFGETHTYVELRLSVEPDVGVDPRVRAQNSTGSHHTLDRQVVVGSKFP